MMEILALILGGLGVFFIIKYIRYRRYRLPKQSARSEKTIHHINLPAAFRHGRRGTARGVRVEVVPFGETERQCLTFRLETVDNEGNVVELISVRVEAKEISGTIMEGDTLVVAGRRNRQGLFVPKKIYNESTTSQVKLIGFSFFGTAMGCFMGLLFIASVFGLIGGGVLLIDEPDVGVPVLLISAVVMIFAIYITNKKRFG